jgi:hypothetical protein
MALPAESARRRALSSIIFVIALTLIVGIGGAAIRSGSDAFAEACVACFASDGGPSSAFADAAVDVAAAGAAGVLPDGMIGDVTPGLTTLAGGPEGATSRLTASVFGAAATSGFTGLVGAAADGATAFFDESVAS